MLVEFANRKNEDGSKQRSAAYQCFLVEEQDYDDVEELVESGRLVSILWPENLVLADEERIKPELPTAIFTKEIVRVLVLGNKYSLLEQLFDIRIGFVDNETIFIIAHEL
ncbi:hypothetical protein QAD02_012563 [Eretmocerus hayati]|uniref:Uncharacterized protein n=1 Tax=Eretmocerus hayati TaxID=131215 RepID=A0ACC2P024_9HYME|nr:hypothetical protein QAD02_012563 [Eretmocerus hayati]